MSKEPTKANRPTKQYPKLTRQEGQNYEASCPPGFQIQELMGMRTHEPAFGIYETAIGALGVSAEKHCSLMSAMFSELGPRNAVEAMLIAQMTATHVAMTNLSDRMSQQTYSEVRESCERSMTRPPIRFNGVDAPELDEPGGVEGKRWMTRNYGEQTVRYILTGAKTYDRWVGTCYGSSGEDISAEVIAAGFARDCPRYSGGH